MKKWTHKECFDFFGVVPRNYRWSWSARNENTVVLTIWNDGFRRDDDGKLIYQRTHGTGKPGLSELADNLDFARQNFDGDFQVIIAIATDPGASTRTIKTCWPAPGMLFNIRTWNPETGELVAEAIDPRDPVVLARTEGGNEVIFHPQGSGPFAQ
jgi:hypothetical protein